MNKDDIFRKSDWSMDLIIGPNQDNSIDCGVFACMAMEYASRGVLDLYTYLKEIEKTPKMAKEIKVFRYRMLLELQTKGQYDFANKSNEDIIFAGETFMRAHKSDLGQEDARKQTRMPADRQSSSTTTLSGRQASTDKQVFSFCLRNLLIS